MPNELKKNLPFEEYKEVKACHKSALKHVDTAKHLAQFESKAMDSDALRVGKIFHSLLLEPDITLEIENYADQEWIKKSDHPESKSINEQKAEWKSSRELFYLNDQEKEDINLMAMAVHNNPLAKRLLDNEGHIEPSFFWDDPITGLKCKTRLDFLRNDDIIVEVKTTKDPSPEGFARQIYSLDYQVGAWFNREGFRHVSGRDIKSYIYIAVGKSAPHAVGVYQMNTHDFDGGEIKGIPKMVRYKMIKDGCYQDYNQQDDGEYDVIPVQTPAWEMKLIDDEMGEIDAPEEDGEL